eukprot:s46_g36.t2
MHVTELIFVVDFEGRTLRGNCQLHFSRSREATQVELQQWLKVEEVTSEGSRLDFHIVEEDTTQKCLVEAPFGADEFQLQIQFVVVPGSPALWWHQEDQLLVAKQAAGRALLPRPDGLGGRDGFSFSSCCFSRPPECFDEMFTFERCCLVSSAELELTDFRKRWPALARNISPYGAAGVRCPRWRRRAALSAARRQLRRAWWSFTSGAGVVVAISELLAFYVLKLDWFRHDPGAAWSVELRRHEIRVWKRLRQGMEQQRLAPFEACACAGKGYDMLMAMRDNIKRLWLYHPNFTGMLTSPGEPAHHMSMLQSCVEPQLAQEALLLFEQTSLQTNCVSGDVATNIAVAQACTLQRKWDRAADLYLLAFALVVLAPWTDCLTLSFWDMTAEDVVYNAARLARLPNRRAAAFPSTPRAAVRQVAWRRSPFRLMPVHQNRCDGPIPLDGFCLESGAIMVSKWRGSDVRTALCAEFGAFDSPNLVKEAKLEQIQQDVDLSGELKNLKAFLVPVGTPFPNVWHALHWWVPALALKEERGWLATELQVVIVFDNQPRHGEARWDIQRPQSETVVTFATFHQPILRALSAHPVLVLAHVTEKICFQQGTVGFRSFRYDMKEPQMSRQHLALFRRALALHAGVTLAKETQCEVLIINRAAGRPRHISNLHLLTARLQLSRLGRGPRFQVLSRALESHSLLEQFALASQADVLVGAHGAGLAWMVAMNPGSAVLELMPENLPGYVACVDSWDHPRNLRHSIYGGLAHFVGQHHICIKGNGTMPPSFEVNNFREKSFEIPLQLTARRVHEGLAPATPHSAPCTLSLYVPVGMMVVACGRLHEPADGKTIEGYQPFTFMVDQAALEDLAFAAGDLQVDQGSFGLLVGQSHTPFGSFLAAKEELELVLESLKEALAYVVTPLEAGALGMNSLQVAVLPDQSLPHGGFGLPGQFGFSVLTQQRSLMEDQGPECSAIHRGDGGLTWAMALWLPAVVITDGNDEVLANLRRNWPTADVRRFRWEVPEDQQTLSQDGAFDLILGSDLLLDSRHRDAFRAALRSLLVVRCRKPRGLADGTQPVRCCRCADAIRADGFLVDDKLHQESWEDVVVDDTSDPGYPPKPRKLSLMMLPASLVPCDQGSMSHLVALHLVEVVLGSCQKGQDRCILRGLIALVWQRLMSQVHGNGGDFLQCLPWRWMEQAEPEGRFTPASQALFSWLLRCETISSAELDDFISQLLLRSREGQISEEELSATTRRCLPGLAQGSWPSVSSCQEKLNAHRRWLQGQPHFQEVHKVLQAWEKIVPSESVGSSSSALSKLIIRTSIHVKVKWSIFQKLYFLEQLLEGFSYRENIIHMGNAYGFDHSKNVELLARWCLVLVKHNCQDHIEVLKRFLLYQSNFGYTTALFHAVTDKASIDTRWKFLARDLWDLAQPQLNTQLQHHIFQILNTTNCIGQF